MSVLEDRYRAVLRLLPASYRAVWEEEMVSTFADTSRTGNTEDDELLAELGRPSRSEVASVVALAVRLRLGGPSAPPRAFACGEAVRSLALVGLLVNALLVIAGLVQQVWTVEGLPLPAATRAALAASPLPPPGASAASVLPLLGLGWVAGYLALVTGRWRAARVLAMVALLPPVVSTAGTAAELAAGEAPVTSLLVEGCWLLVATLVVLALAAFHVQAPPVRRGPWLAAFAIGAALAPAVGVLALLQPVGRVWLDPLGLLCLAWVVAALLPGLTRQVSPALAMALLGLPLLVLRLVTVLAYGGSGLGREAVLLGLVEAAAVALLGLPLLARTLRRLPPAGRATTRSSERS